MKILICFFANFVLVMICVRCDKDCANTHFFDLPLEVYGVSDTVSIGDTITIKINIPDKLREQETDTQYEFIDYDFKLVTYPVRLDSLPLSTATANSFNWFTITGESLYANDVRWSSFDGHKNVLNLCSNGKESKSKFKTGTSSV
jgi:hypothetical protein